MRPTIKLLTAIVISSIIAIGLAFLPEVLRYSDSEEAPHHGDTQAVISLAYGSRLNDENLVDYMASMPLHLGLRQIDWREPLLYIDLYVKHDEVDRDQIFTDIQELSIFSLQAMKNVQNVFLRVYDARHGEPSLLLAVSADSSQLKRLHAEDEVVAEVDPERYVRERFRVQQTSHWLIWFEEK